MSSSSSSSGGRIPQCPECDQSCPPTQSASEPSSGGGGTADGGGGVNPATGQPNVSSGGGGEHGGMPSNPLAGMPGVELSYDASGGGSAPAFGGKWNCEGLAGLSGVGGSGPATSTVNYDTNPRRVISFAPGLTAGSYKPEYYILSQLSYDTPTSSYRLFKPGGETVEFSGVGKPEVAYDAGGNPAYYEYDELGKVTGIRKELSDQANGYQIHWTNGRISSVIRWSGDVDTPVMRVDYGYGDTGNLLTVKTRQIVVVEEEEQWSDPVSCVLYSYHEESALLRHVIGPRQFQQMVNNGIDPEDPELDPAVLSDYAATEYQYGAGGRVSVMYTHGRRYAYAFAYASNHPGSSSLNVWTSRTIVTAPDGSLRTYYFNRGGQMILKKIAENGLPAAKTWYPLYQRFEEVSGRIVLSAQASAVEMVNEANPGLVTLQAHAGKVTWYSYTDEGYLKAVAVSEGESGSRSKLRETTYASRTVEGQGTIYVPASETVYRLEGNVDAIVTGYDTEWHAGSFQPSKRTTILPAVPTSENGTGETLTREIHYNPAGLTTRIVDELGTATAYTYDEARGGMTSTIQDEGGLNLTTDYGLDRQGRRISELGPEHEVDLGGTPTLIRTAAWTRYSNDHSRVLTFRGYRSEDVDQVVGPVTIEQPNLPPPELPTPPAPPQPSSYQGWLQRSTVEAVYDGEGLPDGETTVFGRSSWVRWKIGLIDEGSELKEEWTYFDIPASGYGTRSVNYGGRLLAYDQAGRLNQTTCAGGTIDRTTFNAMGWPVMEELGTDEGLTVTRGNEYDDNGNLVRMTLPVDAITANDRITDYGYDWRDRKERTETVVEKDGGGTWLLISAFAYDNRDLMTAVTGYHTSLNLSNCTARQEMLYDALGRNYRTLVFSADDPTDADLAQKSNVYYSPTGLIARDAPAGSKLFTANAYDTIGRPGTVYSAYEPDGFTPGADPADVSGAIVMEQREMAWDDGGNLLSTTTRQRYDDATDEGPLQDSSTQPKARISYIARYADTIGRPVATANYGTNNGASWARSATVPAPSDTVLVQATAYDDAGNATTATDPAGMVTSSTFDNADRLVTTVENSTGTGAAVRTTHYEYTADGWLTKLKCDNSSTGQQLTEWVRGVTTAGGSALNSNRLVFQKKIYTATTGTPPPSDITEYQYNRQLQATVMTDPNGTVHEYAHDKLGRLLADEVTNFGSGVDDTVGKLETGYGVRGMARRFTSYDTAGTSVLNEVMREFTGFGQIAAEYQEHGGAVNPSTSLKVGYTYEDGSDNTTRPTGIKYPHAGSGSALVISTAYTGATAEAISRPDQLKEGSTALSSWRYVGLGMVAAQKYDAASDTELTYGSSADDYAGYDIFGRIIETLWKAGSNELVHSKYQRNRFGGVVWRQDVLASDEYSDPLHDNYYWYDGLHQVTQHERGALTPAAPTGPPFTGIDPSTRRQQEIFGYDETGNIPSWFTQSPLLDESREHNMANQITAISDPTSSPVQPAYDAAGNMTTSFLPGDLETAYDFTWDAWNRLVEIKEGLSTVATYGYDALTRRITKVNGGSTQSYIFDMQWRAVEERVAGVVERQYVWNPGDRWNLIRRQLISGGSFTQTHFALRDYLDPVAVVTEAGAADERYEYDAFGAVNFMSESFTPLASSAIGWDFLFHGEFHDNESKLYNYGYRYYHTDLGRWLSRDLIGEVGGINLYGFARNDGPNKLDVIGLQTAESLLSCKDCAGNVSITVDCRWTGAISGNGASGASLSVLVPHKIDPVANPEHARVLWRGICKGNEDLTEGKLVSNPSGATNLDIMANDNSARTSLQSRYFASAFLMMAGGLINAEKKVKELVSEAVPNTKANFCCCRKL